MTAERHIQLFDLIAPAYALFFKVQLRLYRGALKRRPEFLTGESLRILDLGCGTGALAGALLELGHVVTGIDGSRNMVRIASRFHSMPQARFQQANLLAPELDLSAFTPDLVVTSLVLHGLAGDQRDRVLDRVRTSGAKALLILDYGARRNVLINLIEWLEGGDYFRFVHDFPAELAEKFGEYETARIHRFFKWYIIKLS